MTEDYMVCSPSSMTSTVSNSADIVAGNENGEIERATTIVMLGIELKGATEIAVKSIDKITVLDMFSMAGTSSDLTTAILSWQL